MGRFASVSECIAARFVRLVAVALKPLNGSLMQTTRRSSAVAVGVLVMVSVLNGCQAPQERNVVESTSTRDATLAPMEGGAPLVMSSRPQLDAPWQVSGEPIVEFSVPAGLSGRHSISTGTTSAVRLTDGRIAIYSPGTKQIRYFTAMGEYIRSVTSMASGLGELLPLRGDSLAIFNYHLHTVTVFDGEGAFASTTPLQATAEGLSIHMLARLDDGSFLALMGRSDRETGREGGWVWRLNSQGVPLARISEWQGYPLAAAWMPFVVGAPYPVWNGSTVVHGAPESYLFQTYQLDGSPQRTFARQVSLEPVTESDLSEYRAWVSEKVGPGPTREELLRASEGPHVPETHATFGRVIADRDGNLWVADHDVRPNGQLKLPSRPLPGDAYKTWSVFSRDGEWITDVDMPDGLVVQEIGEDYILGVVAQGEGVPHVQMYALAK